MKDREYGDYVEDILDSIKAIEEYTDTLTEENFCSNRQVQDAVIRRFEIIGEATKHIPRSIREKYPDVPWKDISGMRNKVIHEYFGVNLRKVWETVKTDIPSLKSAFGRIKEDFVRRPLNLDDMEVDEPEIKLGQRLR